MNWLLSIVRIAGASFPLASSFVQLQSEIDSKSLSARVANLEDPVSHLHDDIPELSRAIYQAIKKEDSTSLSFDEKFYNKYSRSLAVLESQGFLKGRHGLGKRYAAGIRITDPSYIMYLCALEEDCKKMEKLINTVDECTIGSSLNGHEMKKENFLPLPVINAVFEIFESKGYGLRSRSIASSHYIGQA